MQKSAGALPISTAMACSSCALVHVRLERLGPRRIELRLGLHDVAAGGDADRVLVARELQRALVARDAVLQQANFRILHAQQEVILRELRLQRQSRRRKLVGGGFGGGRARFDVAPDAAPEIELPGRGEADVLVGPAGTQRWDTLGARGDLGQRQRLPHARLGGAERLVVDVDLRLQRVEVGVAEELPPASARQRAARRGRLRRRRLPCRQPAQRRTGARSRARPCTRRCPRARTRRRGCERYGERMSSVIVRIPLARGAPAAPRSPPRRRPRTQRLKRSR